VVHSSVYGREYAEALSRLPLKTLQFLGWIFHPPAFRLRAITADEVVLSLEPVIPYIYICFFLSSTPKLPSSPRLRVHLGQAPYHSTYLKLTTVIHWHHRHHPDEVQSEATVLVVLGNEDNPFYPQASLSQMAVERYESLVGQHGAIIAYVSILCMGETCDSYLHTNIFSPDTMHHRLRTSTLFYGMVWTPSTPRTQVSLAQVIRPLNIRDSLPEQYI